MKGMIKAIIAGVVIIAIGAGILITGLALSGWKIEPNFEMKRFEASSENTALEIEFGAGSLRTEYYDGERIAIDYPDTTKFSTEISENNGKLSFERKTKWYVFTMGGWNIPDTVIYLPRGIAYDIDVELGAGSVNLAGGNFGTVKLYVGAGSLTLNDCKCTAFDGNVGAGLLTVNSLDCNTFIAKASAGKFDVSKLTCNTFNAKVSAGKLTVKSVECPDITTKVSAGTAEINVNGIKSEYTILTSVSSGSCNVSSQKGTTDKTLTANCSAGSIDISFTEN